MYLLRKIYLLVGFVFFFLGKLFEANLFIARDLVTPGLLIKPALLKVPVSVGSDFQILLLTNLVSMTPGSLVTDVSPEKDVIWVHSMYASEPEKVIEEIITFQTKITQLFA